MPTKRTMMELRNTTKDASIHDTMIPLTAVVIRWFPYNVLKTILPPGPAVYFALYLPCHRCQQYLLSQSANPDAVNSVGETPDQVCGATTEAVHLLLEARRLKQGPMRFLVIIPACVVLIQPSCYCRAVQVVHAATFSRGSVLGLFRAVLCLS